MLKIYVSQTDLSNGYVISQYHTKRPNKVKVKAQVQKELNANGYGDKALSVVVHTIDLMEVLESKKLSISTSIKRKR